MKSNSPVLEEDINRLVEVVDASALFASTVLITGASGLIGSQIVLFLQKLNQTKNANIKILALGRNKEKLEEKFSEFLKDANFRIIAADVQNEIRIAEKLDYIIHAASDTASKSFVEKPVEIMMVNILGAKNILELAREKQVKSVVYLSTMEVLGVPNSALKTVAENDYGTLDFLNVRSSYPESKRSAELLCRAYANEYLVPVKIARLTQTIGPGGEYNDARVASYFARSVIEEKDIVLATSGKMVRNSIYTRDAIAAIFKILTSGATGETYNVANKDTAFSIKETADMVAEKIAGGKIKVRFETTENAHFAPEMKLLLNVEKLENLGWKAEVGLQEMYERLIEGMKT